MINDPVRIVHLLEPRGAGHDGVLACAACLAMRDIDQQVWLVGSSQDERDAWKLGVASTDRVGITLGIPSLTTRRIRELAKVRLRAGDVARTIVQSWSINALALARRAFGQSVTHQMVLATGPDACHRAGGPWRWRKRTLDGVTVRVIGSGLAELWRQQGVEPAQVLDLPREVPGVLPARGELFASARAALRAELRLRDGEMAVLLIGDPPAAADARMLAGMLSVLSLAQVRVVGLVSSEAAEVRRAARFYQRFSRSWEAVSFEGPPVLALPAADVVVWDIDPLRASRVSGQPSGGQLAILSAMRAGIPVIAAPSPLTRAVLGDNSASLTDRNALPAFGSKILNLSEQAGLYQQTSQAMIDRADSIDHASHFWSQVRQSWGIASKPKVRVELAGA